MIHTGTYHIRLQRRQRTLLASKSTLDLHQGRVRSCTISYRLLPANQTFSSKHQLSARGERLTFVVEIFFDHPEEILKPTTTFCAVSPPATTRLFDFVYYSRTLQHHVCTDRRDVRIDRNTLCAAITDVCISNTSRSPHQPHRQSLRRLERCHTRAHHHARIRRCRLLHHSRVLYLYVNSWRSKLRE